MSAAEFWTYVWRGVVAILFLVFALFLIALFDE